MRMRDEAHTHASMFYLARGAVRRFESGRLGFEFSVGAIEDYLYASRARGIAEEAAAKGEINPQRLKQSAA